ncbi:MAG: DNA polymerase I [Thermodesulfovibrionales bacterium]
MKIYLIDGNSYAYRAYYAIKELSTSGGIPTNAVYGFTNMLLKIIREKKPDGIAVSFDSPVPTKRHILFEEYKAHRPETPVGLIEQMPHIRRIISAFNIKVFEKPGYEADDIIGTVSRRLASEGMDIYIVSADKDMLQLVDKGIKIYDPLKDRILDKEYVMERFGIEPKRIPEFMALTGDAVDNIPGIKGIGEKTAKEILSAVHSLDELLENPEVLKKEKLRRLISENTDIVRMSYMLATIDTSVPLDVEKEEFRLKEPDWSELLSLFRELEFTSLIKLIPAKPREIDYKIISSIERLNGIINSILSKTDGAFCFKVETELGGASATGKNAMKDIIVGIAFLDEESRPFYIPICHKYPGGISQLDKKKVLESISIILKDMHIQKVGHNLKYDIVVLKRNGVSVNGPLLDTMIASYLINPNRSIYNPEDIALEYLSIRKKTFSEVVGNKESFSDIPVEDAASFAADDVVIIKELKDVLFKRLKDEGLERIYFEVEMPLIYVIVDMENAGVRIDTEKMKEISKELEREIEGIQRRIYFLAGEEFNINSPKQLSKVLFHNLGFQPRKKTKTGFSTELSVLEELAESHELPREILNYRSLNKLKTTYVDALPPLVNPETGRIHTSFNQTTTATGRLSSSEPNLQNIPIRGEWGKRIREAFIAEDGNILLSADYSQIELRILAHLSQDEGLIDAFRRDLDIHTRTASELFNVPFDKVNPDLRRIAKTVNFGVIYGISPFGLSETLSISREDAKKYIEQYFNRHQGVKRYIELTLQEIREKGYATTLLGRRRPIPELNSLNSITRQQGERLAINTPVQGSAADIIKLAMINIWRVFRERDLKTKMVLQIHDELLFEVPLQELQIVKDIVKKEMEEVIELSVPLKVEIGYGKNWAEAH